MYPHTPDTCGSGQHAGRNVALVVDDNADVRETLRCVLDLLQFEVRTACNGSDALDQLQAGLHPDLILLDLQMPVMDGPTFYQKLRALDDAKLAGTSVVVVTASCERNLSGVHCTLRKPYGLDELLGCISPWM